MPLGLRRRIGAVGQNALRAAWSLPGAREARIVLASRNGEFDRTLSILNSLAAGEPVSPADFTLSVHHALAGLLAIAQSNRRGHTAVAAGPESFECGLLEAALCLAENPAEPVSLLYFDAPLPPPYADFDEGDGAATAIALLLGATGTDEPIALAPRPLRAGPESRSAANPVAFFLDFLNGSAPEASRHGARREWVFRRHARAA